MKKTVIYIRQSLDTDKQPHSLDMQKTSCLNYAKEKGWLIDEVYNEGQSSARKTEIVERPTINRLLKDVQNGMIHRVLVFKRDRLARNVPQYLQILKQLRENEVEVHFTAANEPPRFTGSTGDFMEAILAGISQQEGDNIVRRIQYSMIPLAKAGKWVAGTQPYGYERIKLGKELMKKKEEQNLQFDDAKVKVVSTLFKAYLKEDPNWLEEQDFRVVHQKLRKEPLLGELTIQQMWKMLNQPLYKGLMLQTLGGERIEAETPQYRFIKEEEWNKVQETIVKMKTKPYFLKDDEEEEKNKVIAPLLIGLLVCGQCEKKMEANKKTYCWKSCKTKPRIDKVHNEVSLLVYKDLLKKTGNEKDWELLKDTIKKLLIGPAKKMADKKASKIEELKVSIKFAYQQQILQNAPNTQIRLKSLILQYVEATASWEQAAKQLIGMNTFIDGLEKEEVLALTKEDTLTNNQIEQLFSLLKQVIYHKKSYDFSFALVGDNAL